MSRLLIEPFQVAFMQRALLAVLVIGVLAGAVGVFVVLRRLAFVGDALTHTVFPGVVIAFLLGQSIFLGALAAALLSALLLTGLTSTRRVTPDASLATSAGSCSAASWRSIGRCCCRRWWSPRSCSPPWWRCARSCCCAPSTPTAPPPWATGSTCSTWSSTC
jgi:hypothetical protein